MDIKYEDYLDRGTRRIMELFSSAGISTEERDAIVSAFTDELAGSITDTGSLRDYDLLIYSASVRFVDGEISRILSKENASYSDYEAGIKYDIHNTICNATRERQESCAELAAKVDAMIVIGDEHSSNSRKLYEIAKKNNKNSIFIENANNNLLNRLTKYNTIGCIAVFPT